MAEQRKKERKEEMAEAGEKTLERTRRRQCEAEAEDCGKIINCNFHRFCFAMPKLCATYANEHSQ